LENRSSRFESKNSFLYFSRGLGPPLEKRSSKKSRMVRLTCKHDIDAENLRQSEMRLKTGVYRKETAADMYKQTNWEHPWALKMGIVKGELIMYLTRCSTEERFEKAWARLRTVLLTSVYTGGQLQKARGWVWWSDRSERVDKIDERARGRAEGGGGQRIWQKHLTYIHPFQARSREMMRRGDRIEGRIGVSGSWWERVHDPKYACHLYQDSDSGKIDEEK